jgi:crossover junction endodeoxyribonuclease RuvC
MQRIVGIDPGISGAFALLVGGQIEQIIDMPTIMVRGRARVTAAGVVDNLVGLNPHRVVIEEVGVMPRQGIASGFSFGYGAGILEGVCAALGHPVTMVRPNVWKREANVPADKGAARMMATRLWPDHANLFARVKDDGRAEAALLARWGMTK